MKLYRTHIIIDFEQEQSLHLEDFGGVRFVLNQEPTKCFYQSKDGKSQITYSNPSETRIIHKDDFPQNELLIEADSEDIAEDVISIVHGGAQLAYPEPSLKADSFYISEYKDYDKFYKELPFKNIFRKIDHIGFGCSIAQTFFKDQQAIYSIEKYKSSLELASFRPYSIDPKYGHYFEHYNTKRQFHTRAAFAIITAFSVIEELGLEIRSSSKNPRFLDNKTGEWNPDVLNDVQERLIKANFKEDATFDWVYRGNETRIEQELKPYFGYDSEWVRYGEDVRDKTLTFPEAIHNASYLRNFISAHKFNELTQYICPYDVYNVQALARQLILVKYEFWDKLTNEIKINANK